ncbi:hypothetical protein COM55_06190 [Bacillus pseudomycoides]|uniref:helix-turn-helix domain-containing protein n=1 Tax=Bacillus pseudomycoides TaxID=64104 RepID=UPI000BF0969E|nr:helix-turn-helix domain-containing protein [Bacillus pseudomycoides]PEK65572.1 hypothetical protein CN590_18070 [Bacillus pseudomycoides]PGE87365.1 hypothetical protein COM55_06190 [Bacillus pseudomycoides]
MDKQWKAYLDWRSEQGLVGLSTVEDYDTFIDENEVVVESEKITKEEAEFEEDLKAKERETYELLVELGLAQSLSISYEELASKYGKSLRTVKRHIEVLAEKGYLHIKRTGSVNTYYLGADMRLEGKTQFDSTEVEIDDSLFVPSEEEGVSSQYYHNTKESRKSSTNREEASIWETTESSKTSSFLQAFTEEGNQ